MAFELKGKRDENNNHIGYLTLIVHAGNSLEDILSNKHQRDDLLEELERYIGIVIQDMKKNSRLSWKEFSQYRTPLKKALK